VKRTERVAVLEALLARVQTNAGARPRPGETPRAVAAGGEVPRLEATLTPVVAARVAAAAPPPRDPHRAEDLGDWSSLLERDLRDPSPASMPPPSHASVRPASLATPRIATLPPPPSGPSDSPDPSAAPAPAPAPPAAPPSRPQHAAAIEPPDSELLRAIRDAAAAGPPAIDPRGLWVEAAFDLRERRPNLPAATPAELAAPPEPDGPVAAPIAPEAAPLPEAPAPATALEATIPRPRRARRQGARRRRVMLPVAAAAALGAAALVWGMAPRLSSDRVTPSAVNGPSSTRGAAPMAPQDALPSGPSALPPVVNLPGASPVAPPVAPGRSSR